MSTSLHTTTTNSLAVCRGESDSDGEAIRHRAYKIKVRREQRQKYYNKNKDMERAKALERAKRRAIAQGNDPEAKEARKKRHREVQARYYAKKREAELHRRAAFALSLLAPVEDSDEGDTDNERDGTELEPEDAD